MHNLHLSCSFFRGYKLAPGTLLLFGLCSQPGRTCVTLYGMWHAACDQDPGTVQHD